MWPCAAQKARSKIKRYKQHKIIVLTRPLTSIALTIFQNHYQKYVSNLFNVI